ESALHSVSGDRFGILRDVLADLLFVPVLCEGGSALRAVRTAGNGGRLDYYSAYGAGDGDGEGLEADSRHYVRIFHCERVLDDDPAGAHDPGLHCGDGPVRDRRSH